MSLSMMSSSMMSSSMMSLSMMSMLMMSLLMSISKAMSKAMSVYVKETLILAVSTLANGNPSVGQSVTN